MDRRARNELQISRYVPDMAGFLWGKELSWFTDEQISELRRDMIQCNWKSYKEIKRFIDMQNKGVW